jgi:hypothetical protein
MADETNFGCGPQRRRYTATCTARMKKPHSDGIEQRPFQAA